jgi:hypothetical protein
MNPSSLPKYPDRVRPTAPLGSSAELLSSRRLTALGMRAVFLVGIWGILFAFRSVLLSKEAELPNALVGTWQAADEDRFALEFTNDQNVRFLWHGRMFCTGFCRRRQPADDHIEIPDLVNEDGEKLPDSSFRRDRWPGPDLEFTVAVRGNDLSIGNVQRRVVSRNGWPILPPLHDGTLNLKRKL